MAKPSWWKTLFGSIDYSEEKAQKKKINEDAAGYGKVAKHYKKVVEPGKPERWQWEWVVRAYHKILPGPIGPDRKTRQKGVWMAEGAGERPRLYISCPHCGAVMNASNHEIGQDGEIHPCVVCSWCQRHVFMQLLEWNGPLRKEVFTAEEIEEREKWLLNLGKWQEVPDRSGRQSWP